METAHKKVHKNGIKTEIDKTAHKIEKPLSMNLIKRHISECPKFLQILSPGHPDIRFDFFSSVMFEQFSGTNVFDEMSDMGSQALLTIDGANQAFGLRL